MAKWYGILAVSATLAGVMSAPTFSEERPAWPPNRRLHITDFSNAPESIRQVLSQPRAVFTDGADGVMIYAFDDGNVTLKTELGRRRVYFGYQNCLKAVPAAWDAMHGLDGPHPPDGEVERYCRKKFPFTESEWQELVTEAGAKQWKPMSVQAATQRQAKEAWQCFALSDAHLTTVIVALTRIGDGPGAPGTVTSVNVEYEAWFTMAGLERRWDFVRNAETGGYNYAFTIEPDGAGLYYDFSAVDLGEKVSPSYRFKCVLSY